MVAQEVAINYPQRVNKLVLASTTPGGGEVLDAHPELLAALGPGKGGPTHVDARTVNVGRLISILNSLAFNGAFYRLAVARLATAYMKSVAAEGFVAQFEAALGHNALDRLHLIQAPTLVMAGATDRLVSPRSSEVLASRIPGARLVMIAGGSHTLVAENRHRFNDEVLDFLKAR
jgi:3-oxoadipate enol-lactonase